MTLIDELRLVNAGEAARFAANATIDAFRAYGRDAPETRNLYLADRKAHLRWATLAQAKLKREGKPDLRIHRLIGELTREIARLEAK